MGKVYSWRWPCLLCLPSARYMVSCVWYVAPGVKLKTVSMLSKHPTHWSTPQASNIVMFRLTLANPHSNLGRTFFLVWAGFFWFHVPGNFLVSGKARWLVITLFPQVFPQTLPSIFEHFTSCLGLSVGVWTPWRQGIHLFILSILMPVLRRNPGSWLNLNCCLRLRHWINAYALSLKLYLTFKIWNM